jgi:ABC-type transporter Mla subunit MlaD
MKSFARRLLPVSPTRDAANVIADVVMTAKDEELKKLEDELAAARASAREARGNLNAVVRSARTIVREIDAAAKEFQDSVDGMRREINGDH